MARSTPSHCRTPAPPPPGETPAARLADRVPTWVLALALVVASALVYAQTLGHDFIRLDDDQYVVENERVRAGLEAESVAWAFTAFEAANWHPLTWLSHMLDVELFGLDAGAHHGVNALLHALNAVLLLLVFARLTGSRWIAFLVAALFALHPTHVESVAWIAERKDVLSTLFWLLTMLAYLAWVERRGAGRQALVVLCFALGLMAKPMLVTLPFVLLLLDVWPLARMRGWPPAPVETGSPVSDPGAPRAPFALLLEKLPLFVLTAASSAVTLAAQRAGGAVETFEALGVGARLANAAVGTLRYLGKLVWPTELSLYYPLHGMPPLWLVALALAVLAAISVVAWRWRRRRPYLLIGWLWFVGTLVPVVGLVQVGGQAIADRYTYVPSIGIAWIVAAALAEWVGSRPRDLRWAAALAGAMLVVLGALAWKQTSYWENSFTLFERSIAVTEDNYLLENNLGAAYTERGEPRRALPLLESATAVRPAYAEAHNNLGLARLRLGDAAGAIESYSRALELEPGDPAFATNLGEALAAAGRLPEAIDTLRRAVEAGGGARAHNNLANALAESGRMGAAIEEYGRALALDPEYAAAWANRAQVLVAQGRLDAAAADYRRAVELDPDAPATLVGYATVLADQGRVPEAVTLLRRAVRLAPEMPQARFFLGLGLLAGGDRNGAIEQYQALTRLAPPLADQLAREIEAAGG